MTRKELKDMVWIIIQNRYSGQLSVEESVRIVAERHTPNFNRELWEKELAKQTEEY